MANERVDREWSPDPLSVWSLRRDDVPDGEPIVVGFQHPFDPYRASVDDAGDEDALRSIAHRYLARAADLPLKPPLRLGADWIASLGDGRPDGPIAWVPLDSRQLASQPLVHPSFASFRIGRPGGADQSVVLIAAQQVKGDFLGSGFGLKVVLQLHRLENGRSEVAIFGLTALLPSPPSPAARRALVRLDVAPFLRQLQALVAPLIDPNTLLVRGLRPVGTKLAAYEISGIAVAKPTKSSSIGLVPIVSDAIVIRVTTAGRKQEVQVVHRTPLIADVRDFQRDPTVQAGDDFRSIRPTRTAEKLDTFRTNEAINDPLEGNIPGVVFRVVPCPRFVRADRTLDPTKARPALPAGGAAAAVRSDDASAVQAFHHVNDLFERMSAYGLDAGAYFRCAKPEVVIAYRSGISPGPDKDGQGVNARVLPDGWTADQAGPLKLGQLPKLFLMLALANRSVRARGRWTPGGDPMPVEPLGIGADANWMWHEFGHVLMMAATGELELRFAHSPGDALAAIVSDPASDETTRARTATRFATFPWVSTPRRHDRCAHQGWGWSGPIHAPLARTPYNLQPRRKGYLSEQILSSSLFRLYRCLGGDTGPQGEGIAERLRASHYTLFLVIGALQFFGDATASPVTMPEGLVSHLCDADLSLPLWKATYDQVPYERVGGSAGKLIRWAFEAQGLFDGSTSDPYGASALLPVDVYIESRRPTVDVVSGDPVDYGPGSYVPVSLHWQTAASPSVPAWQADPSAITMAGDGTITVVVGNRGRIAASGASVEVWWADWPASSTVPPPWNDAAWASLGSVNAPNIAPGATVPIGPFAATGSGVRHVILALVTCTADPSILDANATTLPMPIIDLVAGDNNIGLCVFG